jgi:hypothetical protein
VAGFVKLYGAILESSVWGESLATRVVWITMLAMSDAQGFVAASSDGIARRANVPLNATDKAIAQLESPDARSRSGEHEGRRVEKVDGGYHILNYLKYRELQSPKQKADAQRQRRHRETKRDRSVTSQRSHKRSRAVAPEVEVEVEAKEETTKTTTSGSGEPTPNGEPIPEKPVSWVVEGVGWWRKNVGTVKYPRFGGALSEAVKEWTWPDVFDALKCYVQETKARGKTAKVEWFTDEIVQWLEWAKMPATDNNGLPTARARQIDREFRT